MKNKPLSHKSENTFRFKTFAQQLAEINVNIVRRIGHRSETPEEGETFFYETLCKWNELNCTESYANFKHDLGVHVYTLPQLILYQNEVVDCLKKHLQIPGSLCYQPLLELVVALARDLQYEFYPYFVPFFEIFTKLLSTKDVKLIEDVFQTLSYIFKILWRSMIKDFRNVYSLYSSLLGQGQPEYIRKYAAESIAFLLRKVPAKDDLLNLIFSSLKDNVELTQGIGYLLFEVLRGVQHHFHSNTDQMLCLILSKLGQGLRRDQVPLPWDDVVASQLVMFTSMMEYTTSEFSMVIWTAFQKVITELISQCDNCSSADVLLLIKFHLVNVLKLLSTAVSFKKAKLLQFTKEFKEMMINILKLNCMSDEISHQLIDIVPALLLSPYLQLDVATTETFLSALYCSRCSNEAIFLFTKNMYPYAEFEKVLLPQFFTYCHKILIADNSQKMKEDILFALTSVILQFRPLPQNLEELAQWKCLKFNCLSSKLGKANMEAGKALITKLLEEILTQSLEDFTTHFHIIWAVIICLPHMLCGQTTPLELKSQLIELCTHLLQYNLHSCPDSAYAFVLSQLVQTIILLKFQNIETIIPTKEVEMLLMRHNTNVHFMKLAHFYFNHMFNYGSPRSYDETFLNLFRCLECNLASPFCKVRSLTLQLLSEFSSHCYELEKGKNIFDICWSAEKVSLNVEEYREKVRLLQELEWGHFKSNLYKDIFEKVPLHYLIGTLHVNFQPLWEPTLKLIESYARGMESETFWSVYGYYLRTAADLAEKDLKNSVMLCKVDEDFLCDAANLSSLLSIYMNLSDVKDRVNYTNFRELLWKGLHLFPDISEARNRDISPLLLRFVSNEYYCIDYHQALTQDVSKPITSEDESNMNLDESVMLLDDTEENTSALPVEEEQKSFVKATTNALCVHLSLFSKFCNPRVVYREPELYALYLKLLIHPSSKVQKLALTCIMNYKNKNLAPYKENFNRLLDVKTFKYEIISFSIDSENTAVVAEHRNDVLPILMRILFGKMQQHAGGKANFIAQRKAILQFLANSEEGDLKMFIDLTVHPFQQFYDGDLLVLVEKNLGNIDFSAVVPIRKQQGTLQLLGVIFERLGHRIAPYLPMLLKLLLSITSGVVCLLENRNKINRIYLHSLKRVRVLAITRIIQFFEMFENYPFSKEEIDALFLAAIWPQLPHFAEELARCSSTLLRLFKVWSENPRYFVLLQKHPKGNVSVTSLSQIMELLSNTNSANSVSSIILEMIENLITLEDYSPSVASNCIMEGDEEAVASNKGPLILINDELPVSRMEFADWEEPPNYGTLIVLPHLKPILMRIKMMIEKMGKNAKSQVPERHLLILSRLSEFVSEDNYCTEMIKLLLPFLTRKLVRSEDAELNVFTILASLMKRVENPRQFVRTLAGMFSSQNNRQSRASLCRIFSVISEKDESLSSLYTLVTQLNAWDPRRPEEPDFSSRISGFQYAVRTIECDKSLDQLFYLVVIYNCCYTIHAVDDLSLRDNASHCLQKMVNKLSTISITKVGFVKEMLIGALLPEIRRGIRAKTEVVRHEFITILSVCVQKCNTISVLEDLHLLKSEDVDLDFFENIVHIQLHRRARAMLKLAQSGFCETLKCETLMQFILPLASSFPLNDVYEKNNTLVDAAIELIGQISRNIQWSHYENLLKFYLRKLISDAYYQKTKVKILVAILDGFHFDVSSAMHESDDKLIAPPVQSSESNRESNDNSDFDEEVVDPASAKAGQPSSLGIKNNGTVTSSKKIYNSIMNTIIPQLHKCLTRKSIKDDVHRLSKQHFTEDDEILRAPVAIAMVKLMQHLPKGVLQRSLPGVFFKICTFLKSRAESVRKIARSTLITIMKSLGVKYLHFLIKEMKQILSKGYQVHVMTFTINSVLVSLKPVLKSGDLDSCLPLLIEICHNELFGLVAEEKQVDQIVGKLLEAKSTKAYSTYAILANFLSQFCLVNLVLPLKKLLAETTNHGFIHKVRECLRHIILGLVENSDISSKSMLIFCHGAVSECLSNISEKSTKQTKPVLDHHIIRPDTFLVEKEPGRQKAVARSNPHTNDHIFTEFGLQLLYFNMKRGTICMNSQENLEMLDPFIEQLNECLKSPHLPLITSSLRILIWLLKCPLPSLKKLIKDIAHSLFALLKKYSRDGTAQGSCGEMIVTCFKAVAVLIKSVKFHTIDENQLKLLLVYIEHDIYDSTKQATAFTLLKAILSRQLILPEVHEMMKKILEISITSEVEHIRVQCRQCILLYMLHYPLGKKLDRHTRFIVAQLEYAEEYGRESALEMLNSIFTAFPQNILDQNADLCFVPMAIRMVNEDSSKCRNMTALALKLLIEKVSTEQKISLFSVVELWLQDEKHLHRQLASQLCGFFVDVEKEQFSRYLTSALPLLIQQLENSKKSNQEVGENKYDHLLFLAFTTLRKILVNCDVLHDPAWCNQLNRMWELTQNYLLHPHIWNRLITSQMFGILFAAYPVDLVVTRLKNDSLESSEYFLQNFPSKIVCLVKDFCSQLRSADLVPEIHEQVAKNLVYVAKVIHKLPNELLTINQKDEKSDSFKLSLPWLIKKLRHEAQDEIVNSPKITFRRMCFFKWVAAIAAEFGKELLTENMSLIIPLLMREMNDNSPVSDPSLKNFTQEVMELIQGIVGIEAFSKEYATAHSKSSEKKASRKRSKAMKVITDPQVSARKKIKKNLLKKEARKRKLASYHPGRQTVKKRK